MVKAEIYKTEPNDNLLLQSRGMASNPNEMPWPDPSENCKITLLKGN